VAIGAVPESPSPPVISGSGLSVEFEGSRPTSSPSVKEDMVVKAKDLGGSRVDAAGVPKDTLEAIGGKSTVEGAFVKLVL